MQETIILAGSYAAPQAQGIQLFRLRRDPLRLEAAGGRDGISNPSYLAVSANGRFVYAVMEDHSFEGQFGGVAAFRRQGMLLQPLNRRPAGGALPCHLLLDEPNRALYLSNYDSGSLSMFRLAEDGSLGARVDLDRHAGHGPNPERQAGPHVHFTGFAPGGRGLYAVDLGLDRLCYYAPAPAEGRLGRRPEHDLCLPGGTGPRHFVTLPRFPGWVYVVCELSAEVYALAVDAPGQKAGRGVSTLPPQAPASACAALKASPDGKFLYASNRGDDSIAVLAAGPQPDALRLVQCLPTGGRTPRDLLVLEDLVLAANQDSGTITGFMRDPQTGLLAGPVLQASATAPACLAALRQPAL